MSSVQATQTVNAPIRPTWEAISRMGAVQDWHPNVARANVLTTRDSGIGASRRVEFQDGNSVVETVIEESNLHFTKVAMTESPMLKEAVVTMRTEKRSADTTDVEFSIDYGLKYGPVGWVLDAVMMKRLLGKAFDMALEGLSYHLETGNPVADSIPDRG